MAYEVGELREGILELFWEAQRKRPRRKVALRQPIVEEHEDRNPPDERSEPYKRWTEAVGKGAGPVAGAPSMRPLTELQHLVLVMLSIEPRCAHAIRHMRLSVLQGKKVVRALADRKLILPVSGRGQVVQFTRRGRVVAGMAA